MSLAPQVEAAALDETEKALRELMTVGRNIGCNKVSLAMMLRTVADEMDPPTLIHPEPELAQ